MVIQAIKTQIRLKNNFLTHNGILYHVTFVRTVISSTKNAQSSLNIVVDFGIAEITPFDLDVFANKVEVDGEC